MASRALLLSADEKIAAVLGEAMASGACKLDAFKDIFSAVEAITRDRFDLVLIDWQEALEADFLLKTARDLKSHESVFVIGVVAPAQVRRAMECGADAVLVKPFTAAQAADLLLPALGVQSAATDRRLSASSATENAVPRASESEAAVLSEPVCVATKPGVEGPAVTNLGLPPVRTEQPFPIFTSGRSRMLSLMAVLWPVVIVSALITFDQWPHLTASTSSRLSGLVQSERARIHEYVRSRIPPRAAEGEDAEPRERMPISDDLLSDYSSATRPAMAENKWSQSEPDGQIDLGALEALPLSTRLIASPAVSLEASRPQVEVPASLRFPPRPDSSPAVTPVGQLIAPEWSNAPVALPESVSRGFLEHQVTPGYPEQALATGADGPVVLQASIGRDGAVRELKLVSGYLVLAHAAVDAVKQWRYKPYRRNGDTVEVETFITVTFTRPRRG